MAKEDEILLIAEEEFFSNGYDATSTAVIARKAGVTHAMVNYYYRTKAQLFIKVMDNCAKNLLEKIKPLMKADGNIVDVAVKTAAAVFDSFNSRREIPFIIQDVSKNHPEFLDHYRETLETICSESIRNHSRMLSEQIAQGLVSECTMDDIYDTIYSLCSSPFLSIPMLKNVLGLNEEQIERYLSNHREEMLRLIVSRYSVRKKN